MLNGAESPDAPAAHVGGESDQPDRGIDCADRGLEPPGLALQQPDHPVRRVPPERHRWGDQFRLPPVGGEGESARQPAGPGVPGVGNADLTGDRPDQAAEVVLPSGTPRLQLVFHPDPGPFESAVHPQPAQGRRRHG